MQRRIKRQVMNKISKAEARHQMRLIWQIDQAGAPLEGEQAALAKAMRKTVQTK